jgi:hypothetical protein
MCLEPFAGHVDPGQLADLRPIGPEAGRLLMRLLELNGWNVYQRRAFGGGLLLIAERAEAPFLRAEARGDSLAEAACELFIECQRLVRPARAA